MCESESKTRFDAGPPFFFPSPVAVGYSLGAVILAKYLAKQGDGLWPRATGVDAAACVSSPFCLHSASARLGSSLTGLAYNATLAARLRHYMWRHRGQLAQHAALRQHPDALGSLSTAWLIQHYDDRIVSKLFGYKDAAAYYDDAATVAAVPRILTPTLFLSAQDDPFLGDLPTDAIASNPATALALTQRGGYCAFLTGGALGAAWADAVVVQWGAAALARAGCAGGLGGVSKL